MIIKNFYIAILAALSRTFVITTYSGANTDISIPWNITLNPIALTRNTANENTTPQQNAPDFERSSWFGIHLRYCLMNIIVTIIPSNTITKSDKPLITVPLTAIS